MIAVVKIRLSLVIRFALSKPDTRYPGVSTPIRFDLNPEEDGLFYMEAPRFNPDTVRFEHPCTGVHGP